MTVDQVISGAELKASLADLRSSKAAGMSDTWTDLATWTEFAKYVSTYPINPELNAKGFKNLIMRAIEDAENEVPMINPDTSVPASLRGQVKYFYEKLYLDIPVLAESLFSKDFAEQVRREMDPFKGE